MLVFGIGPLFFYLAFISPSMLHISNYRNRVNVQAAEVSRIEFRPAPATNRELEQLEEIKQSRLARVKKIQGRESLLHFSGALADALAFQARSCGLRVLGVDLQNALIKGKYMPARNGGLETLAELPGPQWNELADPLDLPMLNLPSIEIEMTVAAEYSQVFSFIESLPDFPALVSLSSLDVIDNPAGRAFQLKIRGFYYGNEKSEQPASLENPVSR